MAHRGTLSKTDKLEYIIVGYVTFLRELHITCWKTYTSFPLTEMCKKHGIPEYTGIGLKKLGYLLVEGQLAQSKYWWNPNNPDNRFREMAEAAYNQNRVYKLNMESKNDLPKNLKPLSAMKTITDHNIRDTTIARYQQALKSLYVDIVERQKKITNVSAYIVDFKINRNLGHILTHEKIVEKRDGKYVWLEKEPTLDFTKRIVILCNKSASGEYVPTKKTTSKQVDITGPTVLVEREKKKRYIASETIQKYLTGIKLLYTTLIQATEKISSITSFLDKHGVNKNLGSMLMKQDAVKKENGVFVWKVIEPNEEFVTKLVSDWYDYIEGLAEERKKRVIVSTPIVNTITEHKEEKNIPIKAETPKNQNELKKEIALKLIGLGELEQANKLLTEIIN